MVTRLITGVSVIAGSRVQVLGLWFLGLLQNVRATRIVAGVRIIRVFLFRVLVFR